MQHAAAVLQEEEHGVQHQQQEEDDPHGGRRDAGEPVDHQSADGSRDFAQLLEELLLVRPQRIQPRNPVEQFVEPSGLPQLSLHVLDPGTRRLRDVHGLVRDDAEERRDRCDEEDGEQDDRREGGQSLPSPEPAAEGPVRRVHHPAEDRSQKEGREERPDHVEEEEADPEDEKEKEDGAETPGMKGRPPARVSHCGCRRACRR